MEGILVPAIVFYFVYKTIELFVRQKERKLLIERMDQTSPETLQSHLNSVQVVPRGGQFLMLRLGALSLGIGIGWILGRLFYEMIRQNYGSGMRNELDSTILATIALCAGIALIVVYLIEKKAFNEAKVKK